MTAEAFYLHGIAVRETRSSFILKVINYHLCNMKFLNRCGLPVSSVPSSVAFSENKELCQADTERWNW